MDDLKEKMAKFDFSALKASRFQAWANMWDELAAEGILPFDLWENGCPGFEPQEGEKEPRMALYPIIPGRGIFIICAGGGFMFKSFNEAKPVAQFFHDQGLNAAILDYRLQPHAREEAGADGRRAVKWLRANAGKLGIPADKIAIGGFSAGGMLTQMVLASYDYGDPNAADPIERFSSRPDAALLLYGAFSSSISIGSLMYDRVKQNEAAKSDPVKNLRSDCPPVFIFQTNSDDPRLAMAFGLELGDRGIPFEVHTFQDGPHGGGLYNGKDETPDVPHTSLWAGIAADWLKSLGF